MKKYHKKFIQVKGNRLENITKIAALVAILLKPIQTSNYSKCEVNYAR